MFALVDCNNFYASCERVFRPDLNSKPVVVLSNNDGCVIARSNEAKKLNIPMGAPAFKFKDIFKKNKVHVFSSNFALYGDMSGRVMNILSELAPEIEIYSIDEAFLKFKGFESFNLYKYGLKIREKILKSTGIPISIGFAKTKALTKIANKIAKKFPKKTKGVYIIDDEQKRIKALKWMPVDDIWGIGRRHAKRLYRNGIENAYEFTQISDAWVKKYMSVIGIRLKKDLLGIPTLEIEHTKAKKSIATTRSFDKNYSDFEPIKERVTTFAVSCSEKLRKQKSETNTLMVFLHTNGYKKNLPQYNKNIVINLPYSTNSAIEIAKFAIIGLKKIYKKGYLYKKAGVIVMDFSPENPAQGTIFNKSDPRHKNLMQTLDKLNRKYGYQKIKLAGQSQGKTWKMRQKNLSNRYTTKLDEIIKIKV